MPTWRALTRRPHQTAASPHSRHHRTHSVAQDKADASATRLEHTKDGGVFWQISQTGNTTRTKWGAIGTAGTVTEKEHKDEAAAAKFVEQKVKEKMGKGGYTK